MRTISIVFMCYLMLMGCKMNGKPVKTENGKKRGAVIIDEAKSIEASMKVSVFSSDSLLVNISVFNNRNDTVLIYKPLLPGPDSEKIFAISSLPDYDKVEYSRQKKEKYYDSRDVVFDYVVPEIITENFEILTPQQRKDYTRNIAHDYNFDQFLGQDKHDFAITYIVFAPLIENWSHVKEVDKVDSILKPVYFPITLKQSDDPDSMRIRFSIP